MVRESCENSEYEVGTVGGLTMEEFKKLLSRRGRKNGDSDGISTELLLALMNRPPVTIVQNFGDKGEHSAPAYPEEGADGLGPEIQQMIHEDTLQLENEMKKLVKSLHLHKRGPRYPSYRNVGRRLHEMAGKVHSGKFSDQRARADEVTMPEAFGEQ